MTYKNLSEKILQKLQENGRRSLRDLAESLGVSATTIGKRLDKLQQDGVLRGITADLDYEKLGYAYVAMTRFKVVGDSITNALRILEKYPELTDIYEITGDYDILAVGHYRNRDQMNKIIKDLQSEECLLETNTSIVLNAFRQNGALPLAELNVDGEEA